MNWDTISGNWNRFKGSVREQWGELTNDDVDRIAGDRDRLVGRLQERYGHSRDQAEREVDDWAAELREAAETRHL